VNEDKSSRYHRQRRFASLASLAVTVAWLLALVVSGASGLLRTAAERLGGPASGGFPRYAISVAAFTCALFAIEEACGFAFSYYRGFVVEHRYGLSRESRREWVRDHAKATAVGLAFSVVAAIAVYGAIYVAPRWWWAIAAGLATLAAIVLTNILPTVLLPLFYRLEPLDRPALRDRLVALASAQGIRAIGVFVWGLGEKTRKANAALVGLGRSRRILLSDTLLADYSDDEIEVILAHELAHHVHHDLWKAIGLEAIVAVAAAFSADFLRRAVGPVFGFAGPQDLAAMPLHLLGAGFVSVLAMPIANAVSRRNERRADRFALELTGRYDSFVSAMKRLGTQNLAEPRPSAVTQILFYTHPPLEDRIAAAETQRQKA
jgi:Zn-dependent protease with chaperone function